jgi:D-threo-aldose 1-dehydrogenase
MKQTAPTLIDKRKLGKSDISVPMLGFGAAPLGELFEHLSEDQAQSIIRAAWDGGIRYYDTSPCYGHGLSEHRLGYFLRQQARDDYLLSTKVGRVYKASRDSNYRSGHWIGGLPFELQFDYSYTGIMRSFEDSLMRLGLNRVDLLVIHDLDIGYHGDNLAAHQSMLESNGWKALDELRASGVVGAIGAGINDESMMPYFLERYELDFMLVAMPYTLLNQVALEKAFPACAAKDVSVVIGSPYASGILATGAVPGAMYNYAGADEKVLAHVRALEAACLHHAIDLSTAAIQFPLGHSCVAAIIPGATRPEHVLKNIENLTRPVPPAFWAELVNEGLLPPDCPIPALQK